MVNDYLSKIGTFSYQQGVVCVFLSAVLFGCMPLVSKLIYLDNISPLCLLFYRNSLSTPMQIAFIKHLGLEIKIGKSHIKHVFILALLGYCVTPMMLLSSYNYIDSGVATTLHFIYPSIVILACAFLFKEKISYIKWFCVVLCTFGVVCFGKTESPIDLDPFGSLLALFSGVTFAAYIIGLERFNLSNISVLQLNFLMSATCSAITFIIALAARQISLPSTCFTLLLCLLFSIMLNLATILLQIGTFTIGSQHASILSTFEPITSIIIGAIVFHELLSTQSILGAFCIIASVILLAKSEKR